MPEQPMEGTKDSPVTRRFPELVKTRVRRVREVRGQLAMGSTALGIVAIVLAAWAGGAIAVARNWPLTSRVQILYAGASLLIVLLVLMFGVGSWSRYFPDDADVAPLPSKPDGPAKPAQTTQSIGGGVRTDSSARPNDAKPDEPADPMALDHDITVGKPLERKKPPGPA